MDVLDDPQGRVSFLLYKDFFSSIEHFSDEELGRLFRVLHEYQRCENWSETQEQSIHPTVKVAFNFYRNQFILDDKKYEKRMIANRINALKGGRPKKGTDKNPKNPMGKMGYDKTHSVKTKPNKPETGTVTDTVTGNETETEIVNDMDNIKRLKQKEIIELVITDLNQRLKLKRGYSCKSEKNSSQIIARLNEGYSLEDFILVNQKKCKQWIDDPEMAQYLRPETLYSNKFEGYLNQIEVKTVKQVNPKYQTADERRRENNKKVFEQSIKEIEDVHRNGEGDNRERVTGKETEGNHGFFAQLHRELPEGDNTGTDQDLERKFESS